ncbi:MAG: hypothetical protein IKF45_00385 [Lachnospiraceae bacterium]|nr:hypothetical protein [Lachnospiraceae bacterium]
MRLYILELSRYAIAAVLAVYTLLSYQMLFHQKDESVQKINGVLQVLLILAFEGIGSLAVAAGLRDTRYLILGALEMLFIAGAIILFHTIYDHANMLLSLYERRKRRLRMDYDEPYGCTITGV